MFGSSYLGLGKIYAPEGAKYYAEVGEGGRGGRFWSRAFREWWVGFLQKVLAFALDSIFALSFLATSEFLRLSDLGWLLLNHLSS